MFRDIKRFLNDKRADMAEAAIVLPAISLLIAALISFGMAAWTANTANNIAQRAARAASVVQGNAGARANAAMQAANQLIPQYRYGTYRASVQGGAGPGDVVVVRVRWTAPNWFKGFGLLFGGLFSQDFDGVATAAFRVEGW
jgi:Flp pilus assembly protein TadG